MSGDKGNQGKKDSYTVKVQLVGEWEEEGVGAGVFRHNNLLYVGEDRQDALNAYNQALAAVRAWRPLKRNEVEAKI